MSVITSGWSLFTDLLLDPTQRMTVALLVAALALAPVAILPDEQPIYAGIATAIPTLYTYTIVIIVLCALLVLKTRQTFLRSLQLWAPLFIYLLVLSVSVWDLPPRALSGLLHLSLGAVVFTIGATAERLDRYGSFLSWLFAVVAWVQLFAIVAAVLGFPLRTIAGQQALDVLGRATGLTSHPGELAKLLFFCGLATLTLPQRTTKQRSAAWLTLGAVLVGISLAQSRSVLVAIMAMTILFVMLEVTVGRWQRKHLVILGLTLVLGALSLPWLIERFTADPSGGSRKHLTEVARVVIAEHPWTGVGPNGYVAVAGASDALTATGVPVHNIVLLSAAELGLVGAALLWLPFGAVAARAGYYVWRTRGTDLAARAIVSALPGLGLISMTSWGLLQGPYFLIFSLVFGYFGARVGAEHQKVYR